MFLIPPKRLREAGIGFDKQQGSNTIMSTSFAMRIRFTKVFDVDINLSFTLIQLKMADLHFKRRKFALKKGSFQAWIFAILNNIKQAENGPSRRPAQRSKIKFITYAKVHFCKNFINFTVPKYTSRDTQKSQKPPFPQLGTTKPLKKLKIEEVCPKFFMKSPVSRILPKIPRSPLCSQNVSFTIKFKRGFDKNKLEKSRMEKTSVLKKQNSS